MADDFVTHSICLIFNFQRYNGCGNLIVIYENIQNYEGAVQNRKPRIPEALINVDS